MKSGPGMISFTCCFFLLFLLILHSRIDPTDATDAAAAPTDLKTLLLDVSSIYSLTSIITTSNRLLTLKYDRNNWRFLAVMILPIRTGSFRRLRNTCWISSAAWQTIPEFPKHLIRTKLRSSAVSPIKVNWNNQHLNLFASLKLC